MESKHLLDYKNWVVVGKISDPKKFPYKILKSLEEGEFNVKGVYSKDDTNEAFKSLSDVPYTIDVIDLCINPAVGIEIVKEAKKLGINKILIQPGAQSEEILQFCKNEGIEAFESCALVLLSHYRNIKTYHS